MYRPDVLDEVRPAEMPRRPIIENHRSFTWITQKVCGIVEGQDPDVVVGGLHYCPRWSPASLRWALSTSSRPGTGVWGLRNPVFWGWAIVNFVFWIGIGHAGTLISAILCLLKQKWRTSINRAAEAMTIFAVVCAGIFPLFHVGRVWFAWWLFPLPNSNAIWPNFRSPLEWDVFAVSTYGTVSILFWYMGMIPDLATIRDRVPDDLRRSAWPSEDGPLSSGFERFYFGFRKLFYGILAMGWRGSNRHWSNYEMAYLLLAGLSTPLVLSVHTVVSFDFAVANLPGLAHDHLSPLTLLPGPSSPDSGWC
jgi:hypothetical protein